MKKLNLDETWKLCVAMWKWIAKVWVSNDVEERSVWALKEQWLVKHGFVPSDQTGGMADDCFFCHYALNHPRVDEEHRWNCNCPAKKIDKDFHCSFWEYAYEREPKEFYKKIVALNKIRLAKKKGSAK